MLIKNLLWREMLTVHSPLRQNKRVFIKKTKTKQAYVTLYLKARDKII